MTDTILRIDASARIDGSVTRRLTDRVVDTLGARDVILRDLAQTPVPQIDADWIGASFTPEAERSDAQRAALALSDELIGEITRADTLVIGLPVYNFGVPAALKAWIDQIARAGVTFRYTDSGPKGLLESKRAIVVAASGGTPIGSEIDFATGYLRHVLGFVGIEDVTLVNADRLASDAEAAIAAAERQVTALAA